MGSFIQDRTTGRLAGSIGSGRDTVPQAPRVMVVAMTDRQAASMQNLAHALHALHVHPDYAEAVDLLVAAASACGACGARLGYGIPFNHSTGDGPAHLCDRCATGLPSCADCGHLTSPTPGAGLPAVCDRCSLMRD